MEKFVNTSDDNADLDFLLAKEPLTVIRSTEAETLRMSIDSFRGEMHTLLTSERVRVKEVKEMIELWKDRIEASAAQDLAQSTRIRHLEEDLDELQDQVKALTQLLANAPPAATVKAAPKAASQAKAPIPWDAICEAVTNLAAQGAGASALLPGVTSDSIVGIRKNLSRNLKAAGIISRIRVTAQGHEIWATLAD